MPAPARRLQRLMSGLLLAMAVLMVPGQAPAESVVKFKRVPTQFIAALGDPAATSGSGAQTWGLWRRDPGPRGVWLRNYESLKASGGHAGDWRFDGSDWWLEEHGLIMEKPDFPVPPGKYVVTGEREVTTVLTVHPRDEDGDQRWELDGRAAPRATRRWRATLRARRRMRHSLGFRLPLGAQCPKSRAATSRSMPFSW